MHTRKRLTNHFSGQAAKCSVSFIKGKIMKKYIIIICALFALAGNMAFAEEKEKLSPNEMGQYMEVMLMKMMEVYANPKMADVQARYYKNLYDALQKQGFTKEEAMQIVISQGSLLSSSSN
ncbi:MAG: lipoprotein [Candidatus Thiodiazotropha sp.]